MSNVENLQIGEISYPIRDASAAHELSDITVAGKGIKFDSVIRGNNFDVVGNLTIENGIASGFDWENYITLNISDEIVINKNFEICIKAKSNDIDSSRGTIFGCSDLDDQNAEPYVEIMSDGNIEGRFSNDGSYETGYTSIVSTTSSPIVSDEWFWIKVIGTYVSDYFGYKYEIYTSTDGITFRNDKNYQYGMTADDTGCYFKLNKISLGAAANYAEMYDFDGSIDLNESYIIVDGETVWKGIADIPSDKPAITLDASLSDIASPGNNISFTKGSKKVPDFMSVTGANGTAATIENGIAGPFYSYNVNYGYIGKELPPLGENWSVNVKIIPNNYSNGAEILSIGTGYNPTDVSTGEQSYLSIYTKYSSPVRLYVKGSQSNDSACILNTDENSYSLTNGQPYYVKITSVSNESDRDVYAYISTTGYDNMTLLGTANGNSIDIETGCMLYLGDNPFYIVSSKHGLDGQIDLNETFIEKDGEVIWSAYKDVYTNEINASMKINSQSTSDLKTYGLLTTVDDGIANVNLYSNSTKIDQFGYILNSGYYSYAYCPIAFNPDSYAWEIYFGIMTSDDVKTKQYILGCRNNYTYRCPTIAIEDEKIYLWLSSDGQNWDIADGLYGGTINTNSYYAIKLNYNGNGSYTLYLNGSSVITTYNNSPIIGTGSNVLTFGINQTGESTTDYFRGSINLKGSYINIDGERVWDGFITNNNIALGCENFRGVNLEKQGTVTASGLVPAPRLEDEDKFLCANGGWVKVKATYDENTETISL